MKVFMFITLCLFMFGAYASAAERVRVSGDMTLKCRELNNDYIEEKLSDLLGIQPSQEVDIDIVSTGYQSVRGFDFEVKSFELVNPIAGKTQIAMCVGTGEIVNPEEEGANCGYLRYRYDHQQMNNIGNQGQQDPNGHYKIKAVCRSMRISGETNGPTYKQCCL